MKAYNLQLNHLLNPVGISGENLRVTWNLEDGQKQTAFQLTTYVNYKTKNEIIENTGKCLSSQMNYMLLKKIPSKTTAIIELTVWDENDVASEPARIEVVTGIAKDEWKAMWINPELGYECSGRKSASYLRKIFNLKKEQLQKSAFLYATAHGIFNVYINGSSVTDNQFMPGTSQYNERLMVETLEVGKFLKEGENELLITIGDGWYRGAMGYDQNTNVFGEDIALLAQLEIDEEVVCISDASWAASQNGPLGKNDLMAGEEYDARRECNMQYHPVGIKHYGFDNLIPVDTVPIRPHETFEAELLETPNGDVVLDFGQNLVGFVRFKIRAKAGQKITLIHGEVLDENGCFTIENFQGPKCPTKQQIDYVCKEGINDYQPTKTYMGFRYVKVVADFKINPKDFTAIAIYSDIKTTAKFECGNELVNKLFENALWSMKGNFIDIPTDCPTREKSGYTGDCQAFLHTAMYLMDCYPVYAKWLRELSATQFEDGAVAQIAPSPCRGRTKMDGGIGWSDAIEIVPFKLMSRYGDVNLIKEYYPVMKRWVDYLIDRAKKNKFLNIFRHHRKDRKYILDTGWMWGEWLEPGMNSSEYWKELIMHGDPEVGTAYLYYDCFLLSLMATVIGVEEDAKYYSSYADKVKQAYQKVFLEKGEIKEQKRQCRFVRPLAFGLLSDAEARNAADKLEEVIRENGDMLNTGFLTTHELSRVLTNHGRVSKAYDLLLQIKQPSWLYAVTKGCTTIPESWNCYDSQGKPNQSFNHYSYGAIAGWLMDSCCGIQLENNHVTIAPHPDKRLGYAKAEYASPYGKIISGWKYVEDTISYEIKIPTNMTAEIRLPNRDSIIVSSGEYIL